MRDTQQHNITLVVDYCTECEPGNHDGVSLWCATCEQWIHLGMYPTVIDAMRAELRHYQDA